MSNVEFRMTKEIRISKSQPEWRASGQADGHVSPVTADRIRSHLAWAGSYFGIRHSFVIQISSFELKGNLFLPRQLQHKRISEPLFSNRF